MKPEQKKFLSILTLCFFMILPMASLGNGSSIPAATNLSQGSVQPASLIIARVSPSETCASNELCPSWLRTAYDFNGLYSNGVNGSGQTIVIDEACGNPQIKFDLSMFDKAYSLPPAVLNVIYPQGTAVCFNTGWSLETSLDVEWAHVVAPNATIDVLFSAQPSSKDLYGSWSYALSNNLGNQISNSWGGGGNCGANSILKTATTDRVTILASAGDSGAWGQNFGGNVAPADCKEVLTVGGTTLNVGSGGSYSSESAWGGSGGGYVIGVAEPKYQASVKITDTFKLLAKSDVSADADPNTGVWVFNILYCNGWCVVGGTSVACPLWAAFMADVNQIRAANGFQAAGFVDQFLYQTVYGVSGSSKLYSSDFHDVTTGNDGWPAGPGWDVPTGLGSFIGAALAQTIGSNATA
jgi:subtilase family serine protease